MADGGVFAYVSNAASREIIVSRLIADNGDLVTLQRIPVTGKVMPPAVSPDRRFLYAGLRSEPYAIASFEIDPAHGTLTHIGNVNTGTMSRDALPPVSTKPGDGPRRIRFHPNQNFMYVLNEYSGSLIAYACDSATGGITELQTVSALPTDFPGTGKAALAADLHLTPDGKFLYASARGPLSLTAYSVNPESGMLAPLATYPAIDEPRGFAIDPQGQYLIVAGRRANRVACHTINRETGRLTPLNEFPMGNDPNWIEIIILP